MAKYQFKGEAAEAIQYTDEMGFRQRVAMLNLFKRGLSSLHIYADCLIVETPSGKLKAVPGDWIVRLANRVVLAVPKDDFPKHFVAQELKRGSDA